jgi:multidrug resistance efflux pump
MPSIEEQMALPSSKTHPELIAARFLLKPGRKYEEAVKAFAPYEKIKEVNDEARRAGAALIRAAKNKSRRKTFLLVNNRLEGNALETIKAMLDIAEISTSGTAAP